MMRRAPAFALAATLALVPAARAQAPSEPRLLLSVFAGYRGGRALWSLTGQPIGVLVAAGDTLVPTPGQYDTLDLRRRIAPGLVLGASGTYFPTPGIGFLGEIAFLGMSIESQCTIHQFQPPATSDIDTDLCASLQGQSVATSAVAFSLGIVGRLLPSRRTYPYVLAAAGFVARARSTVEMQGFYIGSDGLPVPETVVLDTIPSNTALHLTVGAGVAFSLGTGYQLRFEGRDVIARMDAVTGLANPNDLSTSSLSPPHAERFYHNFAFTVAVDVVFEKRRGRRY
jgi:hypothetical protein